MKRIVAGILVLIMATALLVGCGKLEDKVIADAKNSVIKNFSDKKIEHTLKSFFKDCNFDWDFAYDNGGEVYDVSCTITPKVDKKVEPKSVKVKKSGTDEVLEFEKLTITFYYEAATNTVIDTAIYGVMKTEKNADAANQKKESVFETKNLEKSKVLLYTIFDEEPPKKDKE